MKYNTDKNVQCPFYKSEHGMQLHCEGFNENNRIHLWFTSKELLKEQKKKYCKKTNGYSNCPLYPVIEQQYKEED